MPGRSGRLVAGDGLERGLGAFVRSPGPLNVGVAGVCISDAELFDRRDNALDLRPSLRIDPKMERLGVGSGARPHADPVGMAIVARWDM